MKKLEDYSTMYEFFETMLGESIYAIRFNIEEVNRYYGDPSVCTLEAYAKGWHIDAAGIHAGGADAEIIIDASDLETAREAFEDARAAAFKEWKDEYDTEED